MGKSVINDFDLQLHADDISQDNIASATDSNNQLIEELRREINNLKETVKGYDNAIGVVKDYFEREIQNSLTEKRENEEEETGEETEDETVNKIAHPQKDVEYSQRFSALENQIKEMQDIIVGQTIAQYLNSEEVGKKYPHIGTDEKLEIIDELKRKNGNFKDLNEILERKNKQIGAYLEKGRKERDSNYKNIDTSVYPTIGVGGTSSQTKEIPSIKTFKQARDYLLKNLQ